MLFWKPLFNGSFSLQVGKLVDLIMPLTHLGPKTNLVFNFCKSKTKKMLACLSEQRLTSTNFCFMGKHFSTRISSWKSVY